MQNVGDKKVNSMQNVLIDHSPQEYIELQHEMKTSKIETMTSRVPVQSDPEQERASARGSDRDRTELLRAISQGWNHIEIIV